MNAQSSPQIALASRSPRRRQLLDQVGIRYLCLEIDVDEQRQPGEGVEAYVTRVARDKASAGQASMIEQKDLPNHLPVLGADTTVCLEDRIFGKPAGEREAAQMLRALSGRRHRVLTAVAVMTPERELSAVSESAVEFAPLSDHAISQYWKTGEPEDKAGAYAVQGLAAGFIRSIQGSFSGIMGLPLFETVTLLRTAGLFEADTLFGDVAHE